MSAGGWLCPSAEPHDPDAVVFGVVGGTAHEPEVAYLDHTTPVSAELLELAEPVLPTEVFRFAGTCAGEGCRQFSDGGCSIGSRLVTIAPPVVQRLPRCSIRSRCRWWAEQGRDACLRCPAVVTVNHAPSLTAIAVAGDTGVEAGAERDRQR